MVNSCTEKHPSIEVRRIFTVWPRSFSEKRWVSARHSEAVCGIRPAVSLGRLTLSVSVRIFTVRSLPPVSATASTLTAPSAAATPSREAKYLSSSCVRPSVVIRRKS